MKRLLMGIRADAGQSYRSIETLANEARLILQYSPDQPLDARRFFDKDLGEITVGSNSNSFKLREAIEDMKAEGVSRWISEDQVMEIALSNHTHGMLRYAHPRAAYTIFHEFGHVVLHSDQIMRLAGLSLQSQVALHRDKTPHTACWDTEWQANAFAAAILMPAEGIDVLKKSNGKIDAGTVAANFGTSEEAAFYRLESLKKM